MEVSKTIKTSEGTVVFEGNLTQDEADLVIGIGLTSLLKAGAIPFKVLKQTDVSSYTEDNGEVH